MSANRRQTPPAVASIAGFAARRYGTALQRYLMRRLRRGEDVQDLAQEVYLRLMRMGKEEFLRESPAYLYWLASHVVYEFKRKARYELVSFDSAAVDEWTEHPPQINYDDPSKRLDLSRQLDNALEQLSPKYRAVLLLHKRDGMSYAEVAETLHISVHTVKKYLARALATVRASKWER